MLLYVLGLCYRDDDHISSSPMISSHPIALFLKKKNLPFIIDWFVRLPFVVFTHSYCLYFCYSRSYYWGNKKTKKKERKNRRQKDSARTFCSIFLSPFSRSVVRLVSHAHSSYSSVFFAIVKHAHTRMPLIHCIFKMRQKVVSWERKRLITNIISRELFVVYLTSKEQ